MEPGSFQCRCLEKIPKLLRPGYKLSRLPRSDARLPEADFRDGYPDLQSGGVVGLMTLLMALLMVCDWPGCSEISRNSTVTQKRYHNMIANYVASW